MTHYQNFIGIDMGTFTFVVAVNDTKKTIEYENSPAGISQFIEEHQALLPEALSVVETTGGYELPLLYTLCSASYPTHRADTRKVKAFIRSLGSQAKTDALDARALAFYAKERAERLSLFTPQSSASVELFQLLQRRKDLTDFLVAEKNRQDKPTTLLVQKSYATLVATIQTQLAEITQAIGQIIKSDPVLKEKQKVLKTIDGIGDVVSFHLLILLPELGSLSRRKIAALAGVAPRANESGRFQGYRRTGRGRNGVKPILFIAAMSARNAKAGLLRVFYDRLVESGKKKMVAMVALMRKILVIANARIRDLALT